MDHHTEGALARLVEIAKSDTGQARRVADFILAWWKARELGGFDLADLWYVDAAISRDMLTIVSVLTRQTSAVYPDAFRGRHHRDHRAVAPTGARGTGELA